ncbi:DUF1453 domain-containing protein [Rhodanobacter sp. DHG33]|uniref:DUF1453 domain-containing protein n=1 Tax=Rhodanobacter sp. DHG33 TaxID=2775921 RepID=UPI00178535B7|nr:DUF1453 domain-containing protein [Rhodanobacter sp. DHG33]MBD8898604.1 DUF1453 domain-containing protein [Rhodanobacter sp. DHG33]
MPAHLMNYVIIVPLIALMIWRRISRNFGRQPIRRKRMIARIAIFAVIGALLMLTGLHDIRLAEGLLGGAVIGAALGFVGLRLTRFETDPVKGDCYVPNPWIGAVLTALLLGRLVWRFMALAPQMQQAQALAASAPPGTDVSMGYQASPLTLLMVGLLVGYYIVYFAGLLVHHKRYQQSRAATAG